ncbi:hypothetical protein FKP32DRAFT_1677610 [Trametes sanguinea]|nr:hypothetical protein FKP32DRAFT_1677610 [Trametes sanguinea]
MPVRRARSASTGNCQVVPAEDELPCTQPGYRERPRLCNVHRKEYGQLTAAYKATSEEAEALYVEVRAREVTVDASDACVVEDALELVRMCVEKIDKEIRERQEHHRRFFVELDDGHEGWIESLRKKRQIVENTASQIRRAHEREMEANRWQTDRELFPPLSLHRTHSSHEERARTSWTKFTAQRRSSTASYATPQSALFEARWGVPLCRVRLRENPNRIGGSGAAYCSAAAVDATGRWCAAHFDEFHIALYRDNNNITTLVELDRHIMVMRGYVEAVEEVIKSGSNLERYTGPAPNPYIPPVDLSVALALLQSLENIRANLMRANQRGSHPPVQQKEGRLGGALLLGFILGSMASWFGMSSTVSWLIGGAAVLVLC